MIEQRKSGFILLTTIMLIALMTSLVNYIYYRGSGQAPYFQMMAEREQARALALGGLQVAMQKLAVHNPEDEKKKEAQAAKNGKKGEKSEDPAALQLKSLLPYLNQWQTYDIQEKNKKFSGRIELCIMCEDGKLNINELYNFEKGLFKGEDEKQGEGPYKPVIKELCTKIENIVGTKNIFTTLEKYLKKRGYPLDDISELLTLKEFEAFKDDIFYQPPAAVEKNKKEAKRPIYLMDIFTVFSGTQTMQPWLFSDSMRALFNLTRVAIVDKDKRQQMLTQALENFKPQADWKSDWDKQLTPLYGKNFSDLPKGVDALFARTFEPMIFSVLCYSTFGRVTQKIYAILERSSVSQDSEFLFDVQIKRIYWI